MKVKTQKELNRVEGEEQNAPAAGETQETPPRVEEPNNSEWEMLLTEDEQGELETPVAESSEEVSEDQTGEETTAGEPKDETPPAASEETPPGEETPTTAESEEVTATEVGEPEPEPEVVIPPREEEPQDTRTPEEIKAAQDEVRRKAREELKRKFQLTEEQKEAFIADPSEVLSDLASDLFLDIYDSLMAGVSGMVPQVVGSVIQQREAMQEADRKFFGAWPQLAKPEYRATIDRISENYRKLNPNASDEEAIAEIGAQAWVALRLPIEELAKMTQQGTAPATQEAAPPPPEPVQEPRVTHIPANPGRVPASAGQVPQAGNEYTELAEEFIQEDLA